MAFNEPINTAFLPLHRKAPTILLTQNRSFRRIISINRMFTNTMIINDLFVLMKD